MLSLTGLGWWSVVQAELWVMYRGLKLMQDREIQETILVESNSSLAVQILNSGCARSHPRYASAN